MKWSLELHSKPCLLMMNSKKDEASIASFKDAQLVVQNGHSGVWGQVVSLQENRNRAGLGFSASDKSVMKSESAFRPYQEMFHSAGFLHPTLPEVDAIVEDEPEPEVPNFVTHGKMIKNWIVIDILECTHVSK